MKHRLKQAVAVVAAMAISAGAYAKLIERVDPARGDGKTVSERQAATLNVGSKKIVAYYVADMGGCDVSLAVSETYPEQIPYHLATVRFRTTVSEGASAEVAVSDGAALALTCARGASVLALAPSEVAAPVMTRATN